MSKFREVKVEYSDLTQKKCQKHTHFQTKAPYDKERFYLKKELARVTRERDIKKKP